MKLIDELAQALARCCQEIEKLDRAAHFGGTPAKAAENGRHLLKKYRAAQDLEDQRNHQARGDRRK